MAQLSHVTGLDKTRAKILAIGKVLQRPMQDILTSEARVIAISFARTSQPFGTGDAARKAGRNAVFGDINKVYLRPANAFRDLLDSGASEDLADAFWKYYKRGDFAKAEAILRAHGGKLRGSSFALFDGGSAHKSARDPRTGRVRGVSSGRVLITDGRRLDDYIKLRQDNVGFAKGVWADVARQLGSVRGLRSKLLPSGARDITANWITRRGQGLGRVAFDYSSSHFPTITISSSIGYASQVLAPGAKTEALSVAHGRLIKSLQIAVREEMRKLRSAA